MARIGVAMLVHDRFKFAATVLGVVVSVLMSNFQTSIYYGILLRNTMFVNHAEADVWITPPETNMLQGRDGTLLDTAVSVSRSVPGVAWAAPLVMGGAAVKLPGGGNKPFVLVGTELPAARGGPFHVVAGRVADLALPNALIFEDSRRERWGGLNLGSVREVNGHRVQIVGFTSGLVPLGPPYGFASFTTAREVLGVREHEVSYVMVGLDKGADRAAALAGLRAALPHQLVLTREEISRRIIDFVRAESGIGKSIGLNVLMSVLVGFAIVALTMFSSVVDHTREFGILKALGAENRDLARLLVVQALVCAVVGVLVGEALAGQVIALARGPELPLGLPLWLMGATLVGMTLICVAASFLALLRVRKVEPAMVFRG
jgi:putative ABC transport system permease protein